MQQMVIPAPVILAENGHAALDKWMTETILNANGQGYKLNTVVDMPYLEKPGCMGVFLGAKPVSMRRIYLVFDPIR